MSSFYIFRMQHAEHCVVDAFQDVRALGRAYSPSDSRRQRSGAIVATCMHNVSCVATCMHNVALRQYECPKTHVCVHVWCCVWCAGIVQVLHVARSCFQTPSAAVAFLCPLAGCVMRCVLNWAIKQLQRPGRVFFCVLVHSCLHTLLPCIYV